MAADPIVAGVLAALPELTDVPEWSAGVAFHASHGMDVDGIRVDYVVSWVLGPWLGRLLDEPDAASLLARLLAVVEALMAASDRTVAGAAEAVVDHWLFRAGRDGEVVGLLGPRSARLLADRHELWAPWRGLLGVLEPFFVEVVAHVGATFPALNGHPRVDVDLGGNRFSMYAGFMYDPVQQRHEDLLVYFAVSRGNVASFELSRGSGHLLAPELEPLALDGDPGTSSFDAGLRQYAEAAIAFTWEHMPAILPLLAEPYLVE